MAQAIPFLTPQSGIAAVMQQISTSETLNNNIEFSYAQSRDTNGWANIFQPGNMAGVMIRIYGTAYANPPANAPKWVSGVTRISHGLGWIPSGFIITYKSASTDVYCPPGNPPTEQYIYLTNPVTSADVNLFIF